MTGLGSAGHFAVIGGGASGVLVALQLLRRGGDGVRVTIVEPGAEIGLGLAYATPLRSHILNTRAGNMSAFPERPDHFWRWLGSPEGQVAGGGTVTPDPFCFVPRFVYGAYLGSCLAAEIATGPVGRFRHLRARCSGLMESPNGVGVLLEGLPPLAAHAAVIATGHDAPDGNMPAGLAEELDGEAPVLICGTGLSMVDCVLSLLDAGHRGPMLALSRRGLLPRGHRQNEPMRLDAADIPLGTSLSFFLRWLRRLVRRRIAAGGDWRDVVDGLRPHIRLIWQSLPGDARARFLRHGRAWWDVHRHRIPPESESRLRAARALGRLDIRAGRILRERREGDGVQVDWRPRGSARAESFPAARIVRCTGFPAADGSPGSPLWRSLMAAGMARMDPFGLGPQVDAASALIRRDGGVARRVFGVGPVTRAAFWEVTAIPDIRVQAADLAERLLAATAGPIRAELARQDR